MKKTMNLLTVLIFTLLLSACGDAAIDTSSKEAMKASVEEMTKDMSEEEKAEFSAALVTVSMKVAMENMGNPDNAEEALREALDGKTADDIIDMSKE